MRHTEQMDWVGRQARLGAADGRRRRDAGKEQVTRHADPAWRARVEQLAEQFRAFKLEHGIMVGYTFAGEDIRRFCQSAGAAGSVGEPHHSNAWSAVIGSILRRWKAAGLIEPDGATIARDPKAHARLTRRYVLRYRLEP